MPQATAHHHEETPQEKKEREEYEAKDDVRTLINAGEIKTDKPRLKRAMAMAKTQMEELKAVAP